MIVIKQIQRLPGLLCGRIATMTSMMGDLLTNDESG